MDMPTMEGEIQSEESTDINKTTTPVKNKLKVNINFGASKVKILNIIKSTKLKTVFILFFVTILVFIGLIVLSSKKNQSADIPPEIVVTTPQPQKTVENSQTKDIEDKLDDYDLQINSLGNDLNSYQPPQIDLNINF